MSYGMSFASNVQQSRVELGVLCVTLFCPKQHPTMQVLTMAMQKVFGKRVGGALQSWHQSMGVKFENAATVERVGGAEGKVVVMDFVVCQFCRFVSLMCFESTNTTTRLRLCAFPLQKKRSGFRCSLSVRLLEPWS